MFYSPLLNVDYILWKVTRLHGMYVDHVFLAPPAAGRPDPAGHGDLGERRRELLSPAAGAVLQSRHAVRQRGLFLHRHRGRAGAAGAARLLRGPQGEQVSAALGRCERPGLVDGVVEVYVSKRARDRRNPLSRDVKFVEHGVSTFLESGLYKLRFLLE